MATVEDSSRVPRPIRFLWACRKRLIRMLARLARVVARELVAESPAVTTLGTTFAVTYFFFLTTEPDKPWLGYILISISVFGAILWALRAFRKNREDPPLTWNEVMPWLDREGYAITPKTSSPGGGASEPILSERAEQTSGGGAGPSGPE